MQLWNDTTRSPEERVKALLAAMTLPEKLAQLGSYWPKAEEAGDDDGGAERADANSCEDGVGTGVAPLEGALAPQSDEDTALAHGIGHLTRPYGTRPVSAREGRAELDRRQRRLTDGTRLGIPAIAHEECLTGFATFGASVYPTPLAWAAAFDPALTERVGAAIGRDMAASGVHQGLSPVLDVVRDYRWGRVEETLGEDPYLAGVVGTAYVRGLQSRGIIATLKHFAGHAASRGARNHAPVSIGPREMADVVLPPFEMAVREGGVGSVMNSYTDQDGVPAAADTALLTGVLREQWGFTGTVVSDYGAIAFLASMHRVAATEGDAAALALGAGLDVELPNTRCYGESLAAQVADGRVPEELVDRAVRRVLRQKLELGLLDADWAPETAGRTAAAEAQTSDPGAAAGELDPESNRALAREAAERSVVLLANDDGLLPLTPELARKVALIGPCADDPRTFLGCYAFPNHVLPRYPGSGLGIGIPTLREALGAELLGATLSFAEGCPVRDEDRSGIAAAVAAAAEADVAVLAVGDRSGMFGGGTSGEGCDAPDLELPGVQGELVRAVQATGTPVVLVVVSGRPYALGRYADGCAALVQAFLPGEEGGAALAGVLTGRTAPSGKLPVQVPFSPSAQPGTYLAAPLGRFSEGISNIDNRPLYPFGHGLSYTEFAYSDLTVSEDRIRTDGEVEVSCVVRNTGDRDGREAVQLYVEDPVAQVARPALMLAGFASVPLAAGAQARVSFRLHTDHFSYTGLAGSRLVEPGEIRLLVGSSSADIRLRGAVELTGPVRETGPDRRLTCPVHIDAI